MFKLLRYIVALCHRLRALENRVAQLEFNSKISPRQYNPYDVNSHRSRRPDKSITF